MASQKIRQTTKLTFTADKEKEDVYGRQRRGRLRQTRKGRLRQTQKGTFTADKKKTFTADKKRTFTADKKRDVYGRQRKGRLRQTRKGTITADTKRDVYSRHEKGQERTYTADKRRLRQTPVYGKKYGHLRQTKIAALNVFRTRQSMQPLSF